MSTTAENLQELLPASEPKPPPNLLPELPAPPGVKTNSPPQNELMTMSATAPPSPPAMSTSPVTAQQTTAGQLKNLLDSGSDYIRSAEGQATRYAASRGLQNSSIAAGAGREAAIKSALPIASQDAGVFERRELTRLGAENQRELMSAQGDISSRLQSEASIQNLAALAAQGDINAKLQLEQHKQQLEQLAAQGDQNARLQLERHNQILGEIQAQGGVQLQLQDRENANRQWLAQFDAATQKELQGLDLATRERMQQAGFTQEQALLAVQQQQQQWLAQFDAATQERLQVLDATTRRELQTQQLQTQERMQAAGFTQEQALQQAELQVRERLQQVENQQQQWLAQFDASTRERLQGLDADVRRDMQGLELETQERIANLNVDSASRNDAARMATTMELAYAQALQAYAANPDIPADVRQTYLDHANTVRNSNLALVEQMFGIDLDWGA